MSKKFDESHLHLDDMTSNAVIVDANLLCLMT